MNNCQEATVRTGHGTTDWFQIGKGVCQGCIMSPCLFNLYGDYIMQNARLDEAQAGIKIAGRSINNLRYPYDTTLMEEIEEELKSLLKKLKEKSEKVGLKLNIQKTKIIALHGKYMGKQWKQWLTLSLGGSKIMADGDCSHKIKRCLLLGRKVMTNLAAAAAKLLQSCLTLCNPIDGSPPGSPVPGILQARTLEWIAISFYNA